METTSPHEFTGTSRFYVERKLGAGGMGIVYLAIDRDSGQQVAIKTLKAVDPTAIFKFKQEFRQLAELVHPHLIRMHELICHNDQWFFVMELVEGAVEFQEYLIASDFDEDYQTAERNLPGIHDQPDAATISQSPVAISNPSNIHDLYSSPHSGQQVDVAHGSKAQAPTSLPSGKTIESTSKTVAMDDADTTSQSISSPSLESVQARRLPKTELEINAELDATILRVDSTTANDEMARSQATVVQTVPPRGELPTDLAGAPTVDQNFSYPPVDQTILGKTALPSSSSVTNAAPAATPRVRSPMPIRNMARLRDAFRQLVSGVRGLHRAGMLHRDLKPANALVSRTGTVVLLDFGLVAELSASKATDGGLREISGTIAYMSPEQAKALPLTEASDWYAVGVMLFQALTNRLPFKGGALQILRRKTAEDAPAPDEFVEGVPPDLNDLCVRLLSRQPNNRPDGREVAEFFGVEESDDESASPSISQLFVGREQHLAVLDDAFQKLQEGQTVVLRIHGRSGAGKSTLIQHFLDNLAHQKQAIVLTGRCYEQESVPYKGIDSLIDAVTQFLRNTTLPLMPLLPQHITALARIFPVLNRIKAIESLAQAQVVTSDLRELRNHAFDALRELLTRIGNAQPLVIYLDDLQWGDIDSAALLADLFSGEHPPRMLLLAAYRSEYIESSVCLQKLIEAEKLSAKRSVDPIFPASSDTQAESDSGSVMSFGSSKQNSVSSSTRIPRKGSSDRNRIVTKQGSVWRELAVEALTPEETRRLAMSLLRPDIPNIEASAEQIVNQSGGSAYFVHELARHLNSGLDLNSLAGVGLDEVLWEHVRRLSNEAQKVMHFVAVSGQPIPLKTVLEAADLMTVSPRVLAQLRSERLLRSSGPGLQAEIEAFHDRIRESIVSKLDPQIKKLHHGKLADALLNHDGAAPETIATHLEGADRFEQAGHYYSSAAKLALQKLAFDRAEEFSKHAVRLAQSDEDKADAHERLIHFYTDMARFPEAYAQGREAAKHFGVSLPAGFLPPLFIIDFLTSKWRLMGKTTSDLVNLPVMQDQRLAKAVRIINAAAKAAYQVRPELCVAVSTKVVNLCLKHGITPDSAIGWMVYGAIFQGGVLGNHPVGYEYGRLALEIVEKYKQERQRPEVTFVVGYFGTSWLRPATEAEALWKTTYESGRATGDLFHTGCSCAATTQSLLMRGAKLSEVWSESDRFLDFLKPLNLREPTGAIRSVRQLIRSLCGKTRETASFATDSFDEDQYVTDLAQYGSRHFAHFYFVNKMLAQYLWREFDAALVTAQHSARYLKESPGMLHSAEHHFLNGLIHGAIADRTTGSTRSRSLRVVRGEARRLSKWAARCPHNFEHKSQLLKAELARLSGSKSEAALAYDAAIRAADQFGYRQVAAIAHQQFALFHERNQTLNEAEQNRNLARNRFRDWGASGIAKSI